MRITISDYKQALNKRYKDLRDTVNQLAPIDGIDANSIQLQEMRIIASIAKLHGLKINDD